MAVPITGGRHHGTANENGICLDHRQQTIPNGDQRICRNKISGQNGVTQDVGHPIRASKTEIQTVTSDKGACDSDPIQLGRARILQPDFITLQIHHVGIAAIETNGVKHIQLMLGARANTCINIQRILLCQNDAIDTCLGCGQHGSDLVGIWPINPREESPFGSIGKIGVCAVRSCSTRVTQVDVGESVTHGYQHAAAERHRRHQLALGIDNSFCPIAEGDDPIVVACRSAAKTDPLPHLECLSLQLVIG